MQVIAASLRRSGRSVVYGGGDTTRRGQFKARKGGATGHASEANATFDWVEYNGWSRFRTLIEIYFQWKKFKEDETGLFLTAIFV